MGRGPWPRYLVYGISNFLFGERLTQIMQIWILKISPSQLKYWLLASPFPIYIYIDLIAKVIYYLVEAKMPL